MSLEYGENKFTNLIGLSLYAQSNYFEFFTYLLIAGSKFNDRFPAKCSLLAIYTCYRAVKSIA